MSGSPTIEHVRLIVGMEVHVELACASKCFSRALSPAGASLGHDPEPNTCIDPVVLGLPGALPVVNEQAVRMSIAVGLALNCSIAPLTRWDRKSYFYADMPKGYQISQYDLPLCFDGSLDIPAPALVQKGGSVAIDPDLPTTRIGIIRAHLEEDAGKLLHEAPGGIAIDHSIVDLNRAGTALLEIVTQPDFTSAEQAVIFCQQLRAICRTLGVTLGVMQHGHMRFEPNINCEITLAGGKTVRTPVVEVKNLNSFKAVRGAIEYELREQPQRWLRDGRVFGPGTKETRGWDDAKGLTTLQRRKEDAHDYRYFPDPDLLPVAIAPSMVKAIRESLPELPMQTRARLRTEYDFGTKESAALVEEPETAALLAATVAEAQNLDVHAARAGKIAGNLILNTLFRMVGERQAEAQSQQDDSASASTFTVADLGITPRGLAAIVKLRDGNEISAQSADALAALVCAMPPEHQTAQLITTMAQQQGMIRVRDTAAMASWVAQAIEQNAAAAADVRSGKDAAIGRLVGAAMKLSAGQGDAAELKAMLLKSLRG